MNKTIALLGLLMLASLMVACVPSTSVDSESLPQVNVDDYDTTTTISDLLVLSGNYECTWDFSGLEDYGVYPTTGSFMIAEDGSYYLENSMESDLSGTVERYAIYDATEAMFYSWNNQASADIGTSMSSEIYTNTVAENTIAHTAYFDMQENVDYGIECVEVDSITLPDVPELTWIAME